jgi:hypothetical protein
MLGLLLSAGAPFVVKETAATADTPAAEVLKNLLRVMDRCVMLSPSLSPIIVIGGNRRGPQQCTGLSFIDAA